VERRGSGWKQTLQNNVKERCHYWCWRFWPD